MQITRGLRLSLWQSVHRQNALRSGVPVTAYETEPQKHAPFISAGVRCAMFLGQCHHRIEALSKQTDLFPAGVEEDESKRALILGVGAAVPGWRRHGHVVYTLLRVAPRTQRGHFVSRAFVTLFTLSFQSRIFVLRGVQYAPEAMRVRPTGWQTVVMSDLRTGRGSCTTHPIEVRTTWHTNPEHANSQEKCS